MTTLSVRLQRTSSYVLRLLEPLSWLAPLLARLTLGVVFTSTGWGKLHNLDKVSAFFAELKIVAPGFNAGLVAWVELVGGMLLLLGLLSRLAAVPLIVTMVVAICTAKASEIHGLSDLFGLIEWTYLVLLAWIALAGSGKASLDHALFDRWARLVRGSDETARSGSGKSLVKQPRNTGANGKETRHDTHTLGSSDFGDDHGRDRGAAGASAIL
jgi:putative oxidoreductase